MVQTEIANLLKRAMGLDSAAIGSSAIERAVNDRRAACNLTDAEAYLNHVMISESELTELIEAVVVSETWFFRQHEALVEVARMAYEEWLPAHTAGVLRVLSLPCATGEEPYSIAMAFLDAGIPANRFQIQAVDISDRALALARRAEYGKNSFRGKDLSFRDRHFTVTQGRWRLSNAARSQVRFQQGNLSSKDFFPGLEVFDIIFCRNLLIYFDRDAQGHAVSTLNRLLTVQGTVFVGRSEANILLSHYFVSAKVPRAFGFHKLAAVPVVFAPKSTGANKHPSNPHPHVPPRPCRAATAVQSRPRQIRVPAECKIASEVGIAEATLLADQGRLVEAEKSCEEHIRKHGASAQALYLKGLIRDAGGDTTEASLYYRKALYLDQDHEDALNHLALLLSKVGDTAGARLLRDRIDRTKRKSGK